MRLLGAWALVGLGACLWAPLLLPWKLVGVGCLGLVVVDACFALAPKPFTVERALSPTLALGAWKPVTLTLRSTSRRSWWLTAVDHAPADMDVRGLIQRHPIPPQGFLEMTYHARPTARGSRSFGPVQVRVEGPLGLAMADRTLICPTHVRVFPDFAAVARYALLAVDNRLSALGILQRQRRGEGMDFHQLREYRPGDSLRHIDWKATARSRKLISREYQDERDQQVVFLMDCGRRMRALDVLEEDRVAHFDQALNALFLLAFVALKQGDAVGVSTFAEPHPRLLAPRKGLAALDHLFHQLFDLEPSTQASDYLEAAQRLRKRLRKRSLIVLLTNLRDEEDTTLLPALTLLRAKHLVLVANLREAAVDRLLTSPLNSFQEALRQAAAVDWKTRRETVLRTLTHSGARLVDVPPEHLPTALVNRYLDMKAAGEL